MNKNLTLEINKIIHDELIPIQQQLKSYEQLANGEFRFTTKQFKKAIKSIQKVIDLLREIGGTNENQNHF